HHSTHPLPLSPLTYTTLFRSRRSCHRADSRRRRGSRQEFLVCETSPRKTKCLLGRRPQCQSLHRPNARGLLQTIRQPRHRREKRDRKSTRLNSSHEWISYAVV